MMIFSTCKCIHRQMPLFTYSWVLSLQQASRFHILLQRSEMGAQAIYGWSTTISPRGDFHDSGCSRETKPLMLHAIVPLAIDKKFQSHFFWKLFKYQQHRDNVYCTHLTGSLPQIQQGLRQAMPCLSPLSCGENAGCPCGCPTSIWRN